MYYKNLNAQIVVSPSFFNDPYCEYYKEELNKWILELERAFPKAFVLEVSPTNHAVVFYSYSSASNEAIDFKMVWRSHTTYEIRIGCSGMLKEGISSSILPPKNALENVANNLTFKYIEQRQDKPVNIFAFGPDLFFPRELNTNDCDLEPWVEGYKDYKVISYCWNLDIDCSYNNFFKVEELFQELKKINNLPDFKVDSCEEEQNVSAIGNFMLQRENRHEFLDILNKLNNIIIGDDLFKINKLDISFRAIEPNIYYIETYVFDEINGLIVPKSVEI